MGDFLKLASELEKLAARGEGMGSGRPIGAKDKVPRKKPGEYRPEPGDIAVIKPKIDPIIQPTKDQQYKPKWYQERAIDKLIKNDGKLLLAHTMGAGKTYSAIMGVEKLKELGKADRALVITPAGLKQNFSEEGVKKFTKATVNEFDSMKEIESTKPSDYNVMSYELFRANPEKVIEKIKPDTLVMDEMHKVRNWKGSSYNSLMKVRPLIKNVIGMTGSPISNKPTELIPLLDVIEGNKLPKISTKELFRQTLRYDPGSEGFLGFFKRAPSWNIVDTPWSQNIRKYTDMVTLDDIGIRDMPRKELETVNVPMSEHQKQLFDYAMGELGWWTRWKIEKNLPLTAAESHSVLQQFQRARAVSNSVHVLDKTFDLSRSATETPKIKAIMHDIKQHIKTTPDAQIVIYSNLIHGGVDVLQQALKDNGIDYGLFIGKANEGVTERKRNQDVKDFKSGKKRVIILSGAGAEGLSFNNSTMHISVDGHFNPEMIRQAEARSVRFGGLSHRPVEKRKVIIRRYVSVLPNDAIMKWFTGNAGPGMDERVYAKAAMKEKINEIFKEVMKQPKPEEQNA